MPRRFENPVEVPTAVFDGLETVQESRETSMLDHQAVQEIAARLSVLPRTAFWVRSTDKRIWRASPVASSSQNRSRRGSEAARYLGQCPEKAYRTRNHPKREFDVVKVVRSCHMNG